MSFFSSAVNSFFGAVSAASEFAKGWGSGINWVSFKDGVRMSRESGKPAMIVIHKSWCRACKALRPRFANSQEIERMSNDFVMINVEDDDEPKSVEYKPDGSYIPRILFLDGDGKVMTHVMNKKSEGFKYYYPETESIVDSMKQALKHTGHKVPPARRPARPISLSPRRGGKERM